MIRILMFDLGETLVHGDTVFPHVREALAAVKQFKTEAGKPLSTCLVSDFGPPPPVPQEKIGAIFKEYTSLLDNFGLTDFFKPVAKRVTLSLHAGALKPDRRVFEKAIERLELDASLAECLFITEDAKHIAACRKLGMKTLQFGPPGSPGTDFADWSEAPLLINHIIAPGRARNLELALGVRLAAAYGLELISLQKPPADGRLRGRAKKWCAAPDGKESIQVLLPVEVEIRLDDRGRIQSVESGQPDSEALAEAAHFIKSLRANKKLAPEEGPPPPGATHQLETDESGQKRLVRKRFNAI